MWTTWLAIVLVGNIPAVLCLLETKRETKEALKAFETAEIQARIITALVRRLSRFGHVDLEPAELTDAWKQVEIFRDQDGGARVLVK